MLNRSLLLLLFLFLSFKASAQLKVGQQAPEIVISDWIKNVPASKDLKGKFVVIDFWATWCAPCLESMPHMNSIIRKSAAKSNLVFLAMTDESPAKVNASLTKLRYPINAAVVTDVSRQTLTEYKISSIPSCVVIDDNNIIQWLGTPGKLSYETLDSITNRKPVNIAPEQKAVLQPDEAKTLYKSLATRYNTYFQDKDLTEYFSVEPLSPYKNGMVFGNTGPKAYNEIVLGDSLAHRISVLLDVATEQIKLPEDVARTFVSYCYKSQKNVKKADVLNALIDKIGLRYTQSDAKVDVIELELIDQKLLQGHLEGGTGMVSHTSNSESYAAIDKGKFINLAKEIQSNFHTIVIIKPNEMFNNYMSLTVKIDNMDNLKESLAQYGIKLTVTKKDMPVYRFTHKDK